MGGSRKAPAPPAVLWIHVTERYEELAGKYDLVPAEHAKLGFHTSDKPLWIRRQEGVPDSYLYAAPDDRGWCITTDKADMKEGLGNIRSCPNPKGKKMPDEVSLWSTSHNGILTPADDIWLTRDATHRIAGEARAQLQSVVYRKSLTPEGKGLTVPSGLWLSD